MKDDNLLQRVEEVLKDRQKEYGDVKDNFDTIAKRWSILMEKWPPDSRDKLTPQQVAIMMLDFKMARLQYNPNHMDTIIDIIGYAKCLIKLNNEV